MYKSPIYLFLLLILCHPAKAQLSIDSLFMELQMDSIPEGTYERHRVSTATPARDYFEILGLSLDIDCNEICEAFLSESESNRQMILPCSFDAGPLGILFSPSGNKMIVYSSYDGPDFKAYYGYRAEIVGYRINGRNGLEAVEFNFQYHTGEWSISELIWIDDDTIALKVYRDQGSVENMTYAYYTTSLK